MAETRPASEQLRFVSAKTGEHILDTYLEASEIGDRQLSALLGDLFDSGTGVFKADIFEFRVDAATRKLQFRVGGASASYQDTGDFIFRQRGAHADATAYSLLDVVTSAQDTFVCKTAHTSTSATLDATKFEKIVDGSLVNNFANKTDGVVSGSDYSAKAWAIGGTGVTSTAGAGAAKEWATTTGSTVDGTDYSAKHYATTGNVATVSSNITNVNTVATNIANVNSTGGSIANVNAVATDIGGTNTIGTVATDLSGTNNVGTVAGAITNVNLTGGSIANVNTTATNISDINTINTGSNMANITTVSGSIANVNTVAGIDSAVSTVSTNNTNVSTVATNIANVNTTAGAITNVNNVGGNIANVNTNATNIANINTTATNIADVNAFAERYVISASAPGSPSTGDLWYDSTNNVMKSYNGSAFVTSAAFASTKLEDLVDVSSTGPTNNQIPVYSTSSNTYVPTTATLQTISDIGATTTNAITVGAPTASGHATTKNYVDTEISGLVDSAPATLNTLNELAAALNDDASFSTTVTNSIATKLPLAGGTMTGDIDFDNNKVTDVTFENYQEVIASNTSATGAITIGDAVNNVNWTLTGNVTATLPTTDELPAGSSRTITIFLKQDGTGSRTFTFAAPTGYTIKYNNSSTQPAINSTANKETIYTVFLVKGSTTIYVSLSFYEV